MDTRKKNVIVVRVSDGELTSIDRANTMVQLEGVIKKSVRKSDTVVMTGTNEFEIVVPSCTDELAGRIGTRILTNFRRFAGDAMANLVGFTTKTLVYSA